MNAAPEAVEPMIGHRDQERLVVDELHRPADDRIATAISIIDHRGEIGIGSDAPVSRVVGLAEPPEQVLDRSGVSKRT